MLQIASHDYEAGLDPELGGGVAFLRFRGVDVLRPACAAPTSPLQSSAFPLVPYANRIAHGRFDWGGRTVQLKPNMEGEPHPLHGDGWRTSWSVALESADRVVLAMHREAGDWPWAYAARQTVRADELGLVIELEVTNRDDSPMPAGLGFHPYFPGRASARLRATVGGVWLTDAEMLPTRLAPADTFGDWAAGAPVASPALIDNCYAGWSGTAEITLPEQGLAVRLTASPNLDRLQLYSPPGAAFFCVEPVSHRPNAVNAADPLAEGIVALAPGGVLTATMRIVARLL